MTFCGTLEHNRGAGFLTLAIHCIALYDPLMKIEDERGEAKDGQMEMFSLTTKQRKDYGKFAATLHYFLNIYRQEELKTQPKGDPFSFFERTRGLDYCEYEFYNFWYGIIRRSGDDEFEKQVALLDQIAEGTPLADYEPTIKFLSTINSVALGQHRSYRGGCF